MNWKDITNNPVDKDVYNFLLGYLREIKSYNIENYMEYLKSFVSGKSVLDIGVVEHDLTHINSKEWKHKSLKNWAKKILGVDILEDEVNYLNSIGYDVVCIDATSDANLGQKFDVVVIGDVIEHVSNPVNLMRFAASHIDPRGYVVVATPNPFFLKYVYQTLIDGTFIANAEHVSWVTPSLMLEICNRAGLKMVNYHLIVTRPKSLLKRALKNFLKKIVGAKSELFAPTFVYVCKLA
jgi:2-polyprenyl-3-methyl-5-hydroxy-6-metoxy-1,4-benzoquinol methylase